jgi:two-component system secretion response regulator SsrB
MHKENIRCVLLADRHHGLMEGMRGLLETTFEAVVMVADEVSLLESALRLPVALVVVDLSLTRGDGFGMIRRFHDRFPTTKMIVISVFDEPSVSKAALEAGTNGFVLKRAIATDLLPAVDAVLAGRCYVSPGVLQNQESTGKR